MDRVYPTPTFRLKFGGGSSPAASYYRQSQSASFNGFKVKRISVEAPPGDHRGHRKNLGLSPIRQSTKELKPPARKISILIICALRLGPDFQIRFEGRRRFHAWQRGKILESMLAGTSCQGRNNARCSRSAICRNQPRAHDAAARALAARVVQTGSHIGVANDGDADRLGDRRENGSS